MLIGQQNKIKEEWGTAKHKATYISKHYQGILKQFLSRIFAKCLVKARYYTDLLWKQWERTELLYAIFLSAKYWPINYYFLQYDQKSSLRAKRYWLLILNSELESRKLYCLNCDYVGTLPHNCFWMLKGLPLFSVTINCSDRKFEFQILEYIPCSEISSIHAQVVLVIKVPTTLPSWMKRREFIKMMLYRGWCMGDSGELLLCVLRSK